MAAGEMGGAEHPKGVPEGWTLRATKAFGTHVGPFYNPPGGDAAGCGFMAQPKHGNKRGVVHGGMIASAFDVALGNAVWQTVGQKPCATVQLNVSFLGALQVGEFAAVQAEITKATRSMVFVRGTMTAAGRTVATADGVWKKLDWRGEAFQPASVPDGLPG